MGLRSTPRNAAATWRMLLQLQTEKLAPYGTAVCSHVTQKLGQISKIWSVQNLDIVP